MKPCKNISDYVSFSDAITTICSTTAYLPRNPCRGESVFQGFLNYPSASQLAPLSNLVRSLAREFGDHKCAIFKPIEMFDTSAAEFMRLHGELPLIEFNPEEAKDLADAWKRGTPPDGVYWCFDGIICSESFQWFVYFQYDFNAGIFGSVLNDSVGGLLTTSYYPSEASVEMAIDNELVWPDGYGDADRSQFYRDLKDEFSLKLC